jgi:hypothetical protein
MGRLRNRRHKLFAQAMAKARRARASPATSRRLSTFQPQRRLRCRPIQTPSQSAIDCWRAQMDGEVREPGYVFTLAEGERGPHKTMVASNDRGMALTTPDEYTPMMRDEPLYEEIKEE